MQRLGEQVHAGGMCRWGLALAVLFAACSGGPSDTAPSPAPKGPGPGFAVEGSLQSEFVVYLYRFDGDVVVQFHPNGGSAHVEAPGASEVCEADVGFQPRPRSPRNCIPLRDGKGTFDLHNSSTEHRALMLRGGRVEEATLTYTPADNFLAADFP